MTFFIFQSKVIEDLDYFFNFFMKLLKNKASNDPSNLRHNASITVRFSKIKLKILGVDYWSKLKTEILWDLYGVGILIDSFLAPEFGAQHYSSFNGIFLKVCEKPSQTKVSNQTLPISQMGFGKKKGWDKSKGKYQGGRFVRNQESDMEV